MNAAKVNALLATAYNLAVGPRERSEPMTPARAVRLSKGDRYSLACWLRDTGRSDLYSREDAAAAADHIINVEV